MLGRIVHGAVIRTYSQQDVFDFARFSSLPTINALTDSEHPCQILADLLTVREILGGWQGKKIAFVGDGFSNMSISWMWAAKHLGFDLTIASPEKYKPTERFLSHLAAPNVRITTDPVEAALGAEVINTDVWLSMGQEGQTDKEAAFGPYQVNDGLLAHAAPGHIVLHCLRPIAARKSRKRCWKTTPPRFSNRRKTVCTRKRRCWRHWLGSDSAAGSLEPPHGTGVTPFFRMILPYFAVSPVMTMAKAVLARS